MWDPGRHWESHSCIDHSFIIYTLKSILFNGYHIIFPTFCLYCTKSKCLSHWAFYYGRWNWGINSHGRAPKDTLDYQAYWPSGKQWSYGDGLKMSRDQFRVDPVWAAFFIRLYGFSKFWRNILIEVVLESGLRRCISFIVIMSNNNIFWIISIPKVVHIISCNDFFASTLHILWYISVIDLSDDNPASTDIWYDKDWIQGGRTYPSKDAPNMVLKVRLKILQNFDPSLQTADSLLLTS